ncbi:MAG: energy transducer TonB [FCB group bacterium]|nr:energy transducer TonB [FCB group bacterium]
MRVDPLTSQYPVRLRVVTILVLIFLTITFYAFPRFLREPAPLHSEVSASDDELTNLPPITEPIPEPEPPRPSRFIPVDDDESGPIEDAPIDFPEWEDEIEWGGLPKATIPAYTYIPREVEPEVIIPITAEYPPLAIEAGIEGQVIVLFFIDENGNVRDAVIQKGIPNTGLDEAALEAVKHSKWKPAMNQDKKVGVWMVVPIDFSLD